MIVVSDDLTGASLMASMCRGRYIVYPLENVDESHLRESFISVDLGTRALEAAEVEEKLDIFERLLGDSPWTYRMDSSGRDNLTAYLRRLVKKSRIMITSTIPELGRFTLNGVSVSEDGNIDLRERVFHQACRFLRERVKIVDSRTWEDIDRISQLCRELSCIPVDPGPLISRYLGKSGTELPISADVERVCLVIGTYRPKTVKQIIALRSSISDGFLRIGGHSVKVDITFEPLERMKSKIDRDFVDRLANYDLIVISGGLTAETVLEKSGYHHILSRPADVIMTGAGTVVGGRLDGKEVILKGGMVGGEGIYVDLIMGAVCGSHAVRRLSDP
ncbi:hypothetical protein GCM10007108_08520 [Thermogymnomonas acidicola]|uniref:Four-carbon acid sugar kinase N-terminal domain-containing protein n=1 Tax=Thermogymnomonas acidicola TaxID=399579 RepID=A0AA37F9Y3_9ARCH|nr:four-carbon acid sugar kinase family protein [Thermogymnomonas acidicola]GGM72682.1 hypothetical protein GCM10007108_08520 [Thermogymnomonas acidicola]